MPLKKPPPKVLPKTCGKTTCDSLLPEFKKKMELVFEPLKAVAPKGKKSADLLEVEEEEDDYYVSNFRKFKGSMYKYPSYNPGT